MKKLLLWLVMVVVMLAVLLGGAGYAMYAMTGDDKLPTQTPLWAIRNWNRSAMTGVCRCWAMC